MFSVITVHIVIESYWNKIEYCKRKRHTTFFIVGHHQYWHVEEAEARYCTSKIIENKTRTTYLVVIRTVCTISNWWVRKNKIYVSLRIDADRRAGRDYTISTLHYHSKNHCVLCSCSFRHSLVIGDVLEPTRQGIILYNLCSRFDCSGAVCSCNSGAVTRGRSGAVTQGPNAGGEGP